MDFEVYGTDITRVRILANHLPVNYDDYIERINEEADRIEGVKIKIYKDNVGDIMLLYDALIEIENIKYINISVMDVEANDVYYDYLARIFNNINVKYFGYRNLNTNDIESHAKGVKLLVDSAPKLKHLYFKVSNSLLKSLLPILDDVKDKLKTLNVYIFYLNSKIYNEFIKVLKSFTNLKKFYFRFKMISRLPKNAYEIMIDALTKISTLEHFSVNMLNNSNFDEMRQVLGPRLKLFENLYTFDIFYMKYIEHMESELPMKLTVEIPHEDIVINNKDELLILFDYLKESELDEITVKIHHEFLDPNMYNLIKTVFTSLSNSVTKLTVESDEVFVVNMEMNGRKTVIELVPYNLLTNLEFIRIDLYFFYDALEILKNTYPSLEIFEGNDGPVSGVSRSEARDVVRELLESREEARNNGEEDPVDEEELRFNQIMANMEYDPIDYKNLLQYVPYFINIKETLLFDFEPLYLYMKGKRRGEDVEESRYTFIFLFYLFLINPGINIDDDTMNIYGYTNFRDLMTKVIKSLYIYKNRFARLPNEMLEPIGVGTQGFSRHFMEDMLSTYIELEDKLLAMI